MRNDYLFSSYEIYSVIEAQKKAINDDIEKIESNRLLNTSTTDLASYYYDKYLLDVPVLQHEDIEVSQQETKIDVSRDPLRGPFFPGQSPFINGTEVIFEIPFQGDSDFFKIRPTTFSFSPPSATVGKNQLVVKFQGIELQSTNLKNMIDNQLSEIEKWLGVLRNDVSGFNNSLKGLATNKIEARKAKLLSNAGLISNLGFKLKENANAPKTYKAPEVKRKINPVFPNASNAKYEIEPSLSIEDYDHILSVIDNMTHVMERSPSAFIHMNEEALRTHFLVQLNGQYEGQATGETFNYNGKTDILIRSKDRNIFIGECKFWKGEKVFLETIDQILGYTSWRDTKTAILIFNKNKDLSSVLDVIKKVTPSHQNFKRILKSNEETEFRYIFASKTDNNREIFLTIKVYDIPQN
jgi:hypothetical protein